MTRFGRRGFRRGRFERGLALPKPVKVGEKYDVEIAEVGTRGDGIARIQNFVIFVPGTRRGDKVRIEIKDVRARFAIGEKVEEKPAEAGEKPQVVEQVKEAEEEPKEAEEG
jgi:predicted RNA-binding protein with TRAM domain